MGASQDVFHTADTLARVAVAELADVVAFEVSELMLHGEAIPPSPFSTSAPLRRAAFQPAPGAEFRPAYAIGEVVRIPAATPYRQSLTDLRPRLIRDLKRDGRWLTRESALARAVRAAQAHSLIVIPLVAQDVVLGLVGLYRRADSAPFDGGDLEEATEFADRAARCLDIVRSRMQGRAHARLLQRALLPEALPSLSALDAAQGHVPTDGTGGEWFDIIPLSSARAALVVGAAEGEGTATAVGMSQLRAMIIALAVQDLAPDEILARLNDAVTRQARKHTASGRRPFDLKYGGSRCLCVVYDPVTGRCTSSAAGASRLVVVHPDGAVSTPGSASHPPLGADDHRFQITEVDLPPGSVLLLDSGGTDDPCPDTGATAQRLHEVASRSGPDVHEILESVRGVGCPGREPALLAVRPRPLDDKDVARRAVPPDAAAVAAVRTWASRQLTTWKLDELAFTTTLVVSELVTNAIRYSSGSIEVRLINDDHTLICEVSDTSSAAPRLRKADPGDEGGRGLSIVTDLTQQQGTRHTARGKTVWTEMSHSA